MQEKLWIQFNIHSCWKLSTKWIQRYFNIWKANVRSTQLTSHSRLKSCKLPQIPRQRKGCPLIAINQHSVVSPCQSSSRKGKKKRKDIRVLWGLPQCLLIGVLFPWAVIQAEAKHSFLRSQPDCRGRHLQLLQPSLPSPFFKLGNCLLKCEEVGGNSMNILEALTQAIIVKLLIKNLYQSHILCTADQKHS